MCRISHVFHIPRTFRESSVAGFIYCLDPTYVYWPFLLLIFDTFNKNVDKLCFCNLSCRKSLLTFQGNFGLKFRGNFKSFGKMFVDFPGISKNFVFEF